MVWQDVPDPPCLTVLSRVWPQLIVMQPESGSLVPCPAQSYVCLIHTEGMKQLVLFLSYVDEDRYYNATFLITNVPYDLQYGRQTTEEFRYLSQEIETMVN